MKNKKRKILVDNKTYQESEKLYHWMMMTLPYWLMYKHVKIDSQHKMWIPRFGWSKKQTDDAKKWAKDADENINWE